MADTTKTAYKDTFLYEGLPTTTYGSSQYIQTYVGSNVLMRGALAFDVTGHQGASIASAVLSMYMVALYPQTTARDAYIAWCTQDAWTSSHACWTNYASGSAWATAGGEFVTDAQAVTTIYSSQSGTRVSWDVTNLAVAMASASRDFNFMCYFANEATATAWGAYYYSTNYDTADSAGYYPQLVVSTATQASKTLADYHASGSLDESASLDSLAFSITLDNNSHAYVMSPMGWTKTDTCKFNKLIYRPISQEIWGSRRDTGQVSKVNSGSDFDGADATADDIDSTYQTGFFNLGVLDEQSVYNPEESEAKKRLRAFFSDIKSEGNLTLTIYTENDATGKTFTLSPTTTDNATYNMVRTHLSRAIRGKYFSLKVTNSSGDDFMMNELGIKIKPMKIR